jgi:hypothetical protein
LHLLAIMLFEQPNLCATADFIAFHIKMLI